LQNITLVEKDGNFNVVDGQQRLTTLTLLLSYFNEFTLVENKIKQKIEIRIKTGLTAILFLFIIQT
jgi:uncharacterized protein with ParB-like and HNH nuclease domain